MKTLDEKKLASHWRSRRMPTFLLEALKSQNVLDFPEIPLMGEYTFESVPIIANLDIVPLMFQAGYLTIEKKSSFGTCYLRSPNAEVENALKRQLAGFLLEQDAASIASLSERVRKSLEGSLAASFRDILAWNPQARLRAKEGNYFGLLSSVLKALNFSVVSGPGESERVKRLVIALDDKAAFIRERKHEPLRDGFESKTVEQLEAGRQKLLNECLQDVKDQTPTMRRCHAKYCQEYPAAKKWPPPSLADRTWPLRFLDAKAPI